VNVAGVSLGKSEDAPVWARDVLANNSAPKMTARTTPPRTRKIPDRELFLQNPKRILRFSMLSS
jgi:hypothetical protein